MKSNRSIRRKGFTLVELLIVIVVIGILSAMMMLSSTEAVGSAKASNIISNLRNLKTAALAWYIDSMDALANYDVGSTASGQNVSNKQADYWGIVKKYLSNSTSSELDSNYSLVRDTGGDKSIWYVMYGNSSLELNVKQKLAARAESVGILRANTTSSYAYGKTSSGGANDFNSDKGNWVFMRVK